MLLRRYSFYSNTTLLRTLFHPFANSSLLLIVSGNCRQIRRTQTYQITAQILSYRPINKNGIDSNSPSISQSQELITTNSTYLTSYVATRVVLLCTGALLFCNHQLLAKKSVLIIVNNLRVQLATKFAVRS
jgi:hypothetical protein